MLPITVKRKNHGGRSPWSISASGPSNAKTITDHILQCSARIAWLMLRPLCRPSANSQNLGDYVAGPRLCPRRPFADETFRLPVPIPALASKVQRRGSGCRCRVTGTLMATIRQAHNAQQARVATSTTETGNCATSAARYSGLSQSRALRSIWIATIGLPRRSASAVPYGTLLCVFRQQAHCMANFKLPGMAFAFYKTQVNLAFCQIG